ncbi:RIP metalloprotease [Fretibacter rubidus]|uniref:M50 family metallopeptidase n=1 Tax=Fretibacter rubidus TaxID=570162 RepID=UPI00352B4475
MAAIFNIILFVSSFLVVLGGLVFFHELGHYSVARLFKTSVERFSIGFGKPIKQWTRKNGEVWSIGRIPLGGYVKFLGDAGAASNPDVSELKTIKTTLEAQGQSVENCFHFKPLYQRVLIVLAGPMANFILAIILGAIVAMSFGTVSLKSVVNSVSPGGAAEAAGVMPGDHLLRLDGKDVSVFEKLGPYVSVRSDVEMLLELDRDGNVMSMPITPQRLEREDFIGGKNKVGTLGIRVANSPETRTTLRHGPISALGHGTDQFVSTISATGTYMARIFQAKEDGKAFGGILRIATITGKSTVDISNAEITVGQKLRGMIYMLLSLSAALSIGLGVANLMPIPALDGGHLLYYGYEAVAGRPLSEQKQEFGFRIGFAVLLGLMVVLTINDIGYIRSLFT